jgi:hypothetical protein
MKKFMLLCFLLLALSGRTETINILWIGNSYSGANRMPKLIMDAVSKNTNTANINSVMSTAGGSDWSFHLGKPVDEFLRQKLPGPTLSHLEKKGVFDWMIIQTAPFPDERYRFQEFGDELIGKIRDAGAEPLVYCTMSPVGDYKNPGHQYVYKDGDREKLIAAYEELARDNNAVIAPVGQAWKIAQEKQPNLDLFLSDRLHPNPVGTYLAVCVFYSVFTGKSPVGIDLPRYYKLPDGRTDVFGNTEFTLSDEQATFLEECAQQAMNEAKANGFLVTIPTEK